MSFVDYVIFLALNLCVQGRDWWLLEVVEHACAITSLQMGETLEGIATDMDICTLRQPLGVTAGICPYRVPCDVLFIFMRFLG